MLTAIIYIEVIIGLLIILSFITYQFIKFNIHTKDIIKLDKYTTKFYTSELDKIITYKTVYYIDKTFGKSFTMNKSVDDNISNDDIVNALGEIIADILNTMSYTMKTYLVKIYGESWLSSYIKTQTLSILLNYTRYTLNTLTEEKFK